MFLTSKKLQRLNTTGANTVLDSSVVVLDTPGTKLLGENLCNSDRTPLAGVIAPEKETLAREALAQL